ncbi:MAG: hypothetical protein HRU19_04955 [Pseudobacteriovorax sp.]|nr:hypothetical protein [Pseudobacteriovorax sp.]
MSPYGEGLNPIPYISAAFGIAALMLGGYGAWIVVQRKRLKAIKIASQYRKETRR